MRQTICTQPNPDSYRDKGTGHPTAVARDINLNLTLFGNAEEKT
jgi:hypothetical protein